jgi:cyclomaltodextrinase / maltogenic alpha-amylase / neopullulanase
LNQQESIKPGRYKHYKGKYYEVTGIANHSETLEKMVVYKALYDIANLGEGSLWVRPLNMFLEKVMVDGVEVPRFEYVE